ncbi:hypothetical protein F8279_30120, partial [Micromonospora sp. AMSO1212t]
MAVRQADSAPRPAGTSETSRPGARPSGAPRPGTWLSRPGRRGARGAAGGPIRPAGLRKRWLLAG